MVHFGPILGTSDTTATKLRLLSVPIQPTEVPKWQRPWNDYFSTWPSSRGKNCAHNDRQTTTIASQQPWNDGICRMVQRPQNSTTVKWQVRNCAIAANFAWDLALLYGCCRFKCLLEASDCDPDRHLQECSGAPAWKCPTEWSFWAILGTCLGVPQRVLFKCFLALFGSKNAKKHSKSTLWGTPRQVPKIAQKEKALRGALSGRSPGALL